MLEPPSKQLQKNLFGQRLCTPRDVRSCSSRVRRLSRNLPTFDSVWLDALVQSRALTAFQAHAIEADEAGRLSIGPCVVLDRLGGSSQAETFLSRHRTTREPCVIKLVSLPVELAAPTLSALQSLVESGKQIEHPGLILPQAVSEDDSASGEPTSETAGESEERKSTTRTDPAAPPTTQLTIASRYCEALSLAQLILRRGRVPAATVLEIARQMLDSLAALHERGLVHGDVSLSNALLTRSGQVVLVDCGIRAAVQPEFPIDAHETPERYDGIAPELIGTGRAKSTASDLYALGCLLWHLLAGRSAFPTGDPLARLAAHQTERIPDIREVAPDTPDPLAQAVLWLTEPNPRKRPRTARAILQIVRSGESSKDASGPETPDARVDVRTRPKAPRAAPPPRVTLGQPKSRGRRVLAKFAQGFQHPALQTSRARRSRPFARSFAAATLAVLLAAVALFLFEPHSRNLLLASFPALHAATELTSSDPAPEAASLVQDLPEPDDFGLIDLPSAGPWRVGQITWTGRTLTIRSTGDEPARLIVEDEPLRIRAPQIVFDGVEIEYREPKSNLTVLALLQSQELTIRNCVFDSPDDVVSADSIEVASATPTAGELTQSAPVESTPNRYAIGWQALDSTDHLAGAITIENSVFAGGWSTIWLDETTNPVVVQNSLKKGSGPFFVFEQPQRRGSTRAFVMNNVTLRESGPVVSARLIRNWLWETQVTLTLHDCVIDPSMRDGERRPLFVFEGETLPRNWQSTLSIDGSRSFVRPGTTLVGIEHGHRYATLAADDVDVRGLGSAEFTYRGDGTRVSAEDSMIDQLYANRRTARPPGIQTLDGRLLLLNADVEVGGQE